MACELTSADEETDTGPESERHGATDDDPEWNDGSDGLVESVRFETLFGGTTTRGRYSRGDRGIKGRLREIRTCRQLPEGPSGHD